MKDKLWFLWLYDLVRWLNIPELQSTYLQNKEEWQDVVYLVQLYCSEGQVGQYNYNIRQCLVFYKYYL